jgi:peptide/nickel transport system substrate-binding protein
MMNRRSRIIVALFAVLALTAASCGGSDSDSDSGSSGSSSSSSDSSSSDSSDSSSSDSSDSSDSSETTAAPAPVDTRRELLVIAVPTEPDSLDEYIGEVRWEGAQTEETLIRRRPDGKLIPWVATDWFPNADGTVWTANLRDDVMWHDGTLLVAQDLVDAAEYLVSIDAVQESRGSTGFSNYLSSRAIDDTTFEITYSASAVLWPIQMSYWRLQKDLPDPANHPVGTGSYRLKSWDRGSKVTLVANEDYWGEPAKVKQVEFVVIPDAAARVAALQAGEVDIINPVIVEDAPLVPNLWSPSEPIQFYRLVLNSRTGPSADVRVRRAMNLAVDKEALNEALFGGQGIPDQCQSLLPNHVGFNEDLSAYPYDPEEARRLITEAGAEGAEFVFMGAAARWSKQEELMEIVGNYWEAVGLKVKLDVVPFQEWLDRVFTQPGPRPDVYFVGASIRTFDGGSLRNYLLSPENPTARTSSMTDPEMDRLFKEAEVVFDPEERDAAFEKVVARLCAGAHFVHLFAPPDFYGAAADVTFNPDPRLRWTKVDDMTFG